MNHLLSLETMSATDMRRVLDLALHLKATRDNQSFQPLAGQSWAMIFMKASTRTRVSFEVGVQELGGRVLYLNSADTQLGRKEPLKDTARVLGRMVHGAIIRTYAQQDLVEFAEYAKIPTINALTDDEHPCQVLADLLTMIELCGGYEGKKVVFMGDGDKVFGFACGHTVGAFLVIFPHVGDQCSDLVLDVCRQRGADNIGAVRDQLGTPDFNQVVHVDQTRICGLAERAIGIAVFPVAQAISP